MIPYLEKGKTIWCPFDRDDSAFTRVLKNWGGGKIINTHIDYGQDFYDYEPEENWDIMLSNPRSPTSEKSSNAHCLLGNRSDF